MRFLIINTDYHRFLEDLYAENCGLESRPYDEQLQTRQETLCGMADFYSANLRQLGHEVIDIYANNRRLQSEWAREHSVYVPQARTWQLHIRRGFVPWISRREDDGWLFHILDSQLKHYRPDVVLNQALVEIPPAFWKRVRQYAGFLVGQISWIHLTNGSPDEWQLAIPQDEDWNVYDLVISSFPPTVDWFRKRKVRAELNRLAFDPRVLERLNGHSPTYDVTFVGSCFSLHSSRQQWLEQLCERHDIKTWMPTDEGLSANSSAGRSYQGKAWGIEMYRVLRNSRITLNHHGNVPPFANNMRLYEATGIGTLLMTDAKPNLGDLFEPEREVVTYRNAEECAEQIAYYLEHEDERASIAQAGQARTLTEHTYSQRVIELTSCIEKYI